MHAQGGRHTLGDRTFTGGRWAVDSDDRNSLRHLGELSEIIREGLGDALRIVDTHTRVTESRQRETHRHAMVVVSVYAGLRIED
jgi:hypothetical protein